MAKYSVQIRSTWSDLETVPASWRETDKEMISRASRHEPSEFKGQYDYMVKRHEDGRRTVLMRTAWGTDAEFATVQDAKDHVRTSVEVNSLDSHKYSCGFEYRIMNHRGEGDPVPIPGEVVVLDFNTRQEELN